MHVKYLLVRNSTGSTKAAVSSVNFSVTSFMRNREAGMVVAGSDENHMIKFLNATFDYDFANGLPYVVNQTYSPSDMEQITATAPYPVNVPTGPQIPGAYITPVPTAVNATMSGLALYASPDFARAQLFADMGSAKSAFAIYIYQITDFQMAQQLITMSGNGINVTILVSKTIDSYYDYEQAQLCYRNLTAAGVRVRWAPTYYSFTHNKFWIVDGARVGMSTGNWSPSDYPSLPPGSPSFPPYKSSEWQSINRDFTINAADPAIVGTFATVLNEDFQRGAWFT